jgi:hypothetical protein
MNLYKFRNGEIAKAGDVCYYSEYSPAIYGTEYADSILVIEESPKGLRTKTVVYRFYGEFQNYIEPVENRPPLQHFSKLGVLFDLTKIGELPADEHMLTQEFAKEYFETTILPTRQTQE